MGVYVYRSRICPEWIKVGHFRVTLRRPDVSCRIRRRGFRSCVHPVQLSGSLGPEDFELVAFFEELTRRHEGRLHRAFAIGAVGEFHSAANLSEILTRLEAMSAADCLQR